MVVGSRQHENVEVVSDVRNHRDRNSHDGPGSVRGSGCVDCTRCAEAHVCHNHRMDDTHPVGQENGNGMDHEAGGPPGIESGRHVRTKLSGRENQGISYVLRA